MILLGIIILVHELGHFWAALAIGVKVETFSIGFGPRLFGIRCGKTDFRLSAIPFGGYIRTIGDEPGRERAAEPRSLQSKARWQRAVVIIAGPMMNVMLAIGIVAGLYMCGLSEQVDTTDPIIASIKVNSPAAQAGLQPGDRIVQFHGKRDPNWDFVLMQEALNANHRIEGIVERHSQSILFAITPRMDDMQGIGIAGWSGEQNVRVGALGQGSPALRAGLRTGDFVLTANGKRVASPSTIQEVVVRSGGRPLNFQLMRNGHHETVTVTPVASNDPKMPWRIGISFKMPADAAKLGLGPALEQSLSLNKQSALMVFQCLGAMVEKRISPRSLSGPIGLAQLSRDAAQAGTSTYLSFMALVSLQLAIFNLLPIPILDGGTLLMLIIEMLLQRDISRHVKDVIFKVACIFLIPVVVFVIHNDISRLLTRT